MVAEEAPAPGHVTEPRPALARRLAGASGDGGEVGQAGAEPHRGLRPSLDRVGRGRPHRGLHRQRRPQLGDRAVTRGPLARAVVGLAARVGDVHLPGRLRDGLLH